MLWCYCLQEWSRGASRHAADSDNAKGKKKSKKKKETLYHDDIMTESEVSVHIYMYVHPPPPSAIDLHKEVVLHMHAMKYPIIFCACVNCASTGNLLSG